MRKHGVGLLSYQQLQEEFSTILRKDFNENQDSTPISTILKSSIDAIEKDYYPKYFAGFLVAFCGLAFLFVSANYFILGVIISFVWVMISMIGFFLLSGVPTLKSIKVLKENVFLVCDSCKDTDFTAEDAILMLVNIKNKEEVKREILLQKYYNLIESEFKENPIVNSFSSPGSRLLCHEFINGASQIPISNNEYRYLIASTLRIGAGHLKNHKSKINIINEFLNSDTPEVVYPKIDSVIIDDISKAHITIKVAEDKIRRLKEKLESLGQKR